MKYSSLIRWKKQTEIEQCQNNIAKLFVSRRFSTKLQLIWTAFTNNAFLCSKNNNFILFNTQNVRILTYFTKTNDRVSSVKLGCDLKYWTLIGRKQKLKFRRQTDLQITRTCKMFFSKRFINKIQVNWKAIIRNYNSVQLNSSVTLPFAPNTTNSHFS